MLGAAEAGFFPGIILYLTWWFPERERTRALALFLTASPPRTWSAGRSRAACSSSTASSAWTAGSGCSWCEGLPAIGLGIVTLRFLDEGPAEAEWLEPDEREYLDARDRARAAVRRRRRRAAASGDALGNGQLWLLGLIYFILLAAGFGLTFFVPDLVQDRTGYSDFEVGALAAVPYGIATVAMLVVARRADRAHAAGGRTSPRWRWWARRAPPSRRYAQSPLLLTVGITFAAVGILGAIPVFWALPTAFLSGAGAAAGHRADRRCRQLGGFAGPAFTGAMEDSTGGFETPLVVLAGLLRRWVRS